MKKIIIFTEPTQELVFDASSDLLLTQACLSVLIRRRTNANFRYFVEGRQFNPTATELEYMNLTDSDINLLPKSVAERTKALRKRFLDLQASTDSYQASTKLWQDTLENFLSLPLEKQLTAQTRVLADTPYEEDIPTAYWLLKQRANYVGEGFKILEVTTA